MRSIKDEVGQAVWDSWPVGARMAIERLENPLCEAKPDEVRVSYGSLPTFSEYRGGGEVLSPSTHANTVVKLCGRDVLHQVREMFREGYEVMIHHGRIVAAQKVRMSQEKQFETGV